MADNVPSNACDADLEESVKEAIHVATALAQGGDADEAQAVLRNECSKVPASALASAHAAVIDSYLRKDSLDAAFSFAMEILHKPCVSAKPQDAVLRALAQAQQHARALELLRAVCDSGAPPPSDMVFNCVLDSAVRARAYGEAWDVLELLLKHQRRADKFFVSILTKSLESSPDRRWVRRGISLVDRFVDQQREDVDEIVFNSLLNVLGHVGDMAKLQNTLSKMEEYRVPPSAVTYGTVVKAYGRAHDIDAVLKVWNDMRSRCLGVNPVTCGCVLDACVKCGHLDKAMAIFQEMRMQGLHKNTVLYATLIKGLAKTRDLMGALQLYQEMRMEGVPCNLVTFNSLMDVCVRCGDLQAAACFLQDMMRMGIDPDLITFSTLIKGYSNTGEVHKALALSKELKSRGLKCDEIMYNSLIDGCAKAAKVQEGLMVFGDMLRSHVVPSNITFSILVKLFFEVRQVSEAFQMVDDMSVKYRCAPGRIVYTVLFRCCAQFGGEALVRAATSLFDLASKRNSRLPDQGMVSAVISGCVHHADFDTAISLVQEFAVPGGSRRVNVVGVPTDCLKELVEVLGCCDAARGQHLIEHLASKSYPLSSLAVLQAAFEQGTRRINGTLPEPSPVQGILSHDTAHDLPPAHNPYFPPPVAPSAYPSPLDLYSAAAYDMALGYYAGHFHQQHLQQQYQQQLLHQHLHHQQLQHTQHALNPYAVPFSAPGLLPPPNVVQGHAQAHPMPLSFPPFPPMLPPGLLPGMASLPAMLPSVAPWPPSPSTQLPQASPLPPVLASHAGPPTPTSASEAVLATMSTSPLTSKSAMSATPLQTKSRSALAAMSQSPPPAFSISSMMMTPPPRLAVDKGTANKENEAPIGGLSKDSTGQGKNRPKRSGPVGSQTVGRIL